MSRIRMSIGVNVALTPSGANTFFIGLGAPSFAGTIAPVVYVKEIHIFQNGTPLAGKSIQVYRAVDSGVHASETTVGFSYEGQTVGAGTNACVIKWTSGQPTIPTQDPIANVFLGNNVGDYAIIRFDQPIEIEMRTSDNVFNPSECLALRVAESTALDLYVTFVWERTHLGT